MFLYCSSSAFKILCIKLIKYTAYFYIIKHKDFYLYVIYKTTNVCKFFSFFIGEFQFVIYLNRESDYKKDFLDFIYTKLLNTFFAQTNALKKMRSTSTK